MSAPDGREVDSLNIDPLTGQETIAQYPGNEPGSPPLRLTIVSVTTFTGTETTELLTERRHQPGDLVPTQWSSRSSSFVSQPNTADERAHQVCLKDVPVERQRIREVVVSARPVPDHHLPTWLSPGVAVLGCRSRATWCSRPDAARSDAAGRRQGCVGWSTKEEVIIRMEDDKFTHVAQHTESGRPEVGALVDHLDALTEVEHRVASSVARCRAVDDRNRAAIRGVADDGPQACLELHGSILGEDDARDVEGLRRRRRAARRRLPSGHGATRSRARAHVSRRSTREWLPRRGAQSISFDAPRPLPCGPSTRQSGVRYA